MPAWSARPPRWALGVGVVVLAIGFIGGITYYSARQFTSRAADTRAAAEADSFAHHSAYLATGDAFAGYLQMLRYADDLTLRSPAATPEQRGAAMQQLLYLNTNKLASLAVVSRAGTILASTDPEVDDMRSSEAFNTTRATLGPANSDIIMPVAGKPGYVEFTAPLKDDAGAVWAILYGRADPATLWSATLRASVDGGQNVVINNEGQFSAGVPDGLLRSSWKGVPLDNGSVRADIAGVDSICGLGPIGRDTQIDHGWNVASCLPVSLIQAEANRAMGDQGLVTLAAAILAIAIAGGAMRYIFAGAPSPKPAAVPAASASEAALVAAVPVAMPPDTLEEAFGVDAASTTQADDDEGAPAAPSVVVHADVDALRLIEAYERRNAALSARLRETVQARMMIAASELDSAYKLAASDPERAVTIHGRAMADLESLRERELRAFGQELHPGLVRLGLPGALRGLAKDLAGEVDLRLDIDPAADAVSGGEGRVRIDAALRLVLYRALRDAIAALRAAGATAVSITIARDGDELATRAEGVTSASIDPESLEAATVALAAYGAKLSLGIADGASVVGWTVVAAGVEANADDGSAEAAAAAEAGATAEAGAGLVVDLTLTGDEPAPEAAPVEDDEPEAAAELAPDDAPVAVVATTDWRAAAAARAASEDAIADDASALNASPAVTGHVPAATPVLPPNVHVIPADTIDATPLSQRLHAVAEASPLLAMTIDIDESADARTLAGDPVLPPALAATLTGITRAAAHALTDLDAKNCYVTAQISDGDVFFSITADTGGKPLGGAPFAEHREAIELREGFFAISRRLDTVTLTAQAPIGDPDQPAVLRLDEAPGTAA